MLNSYENLSPYQFVHTHLIRSTLPDAKPLICVKPDNPKDNAPWVPQVLSEDTTLPQNANLYICISSCNRVADSTNPHYNQYRAKLECVAQTHMFMLDDIGDETTPNKPDYTKLPLTPTWVIETSPHNYQALYVLYEPITDVYLANLISKQLPGQANTDKASVNAVRWARLPGGINNKPEHLSSGKPFVVRIADANPDCLYKVEELIGGFEIETHIHRTENKTSTQPTGVEPEGWQRHISALSHIDPDCNYDTWFKVAAVLHAWGQPGLEAFLAWSALAEKPVNQITEEARTQKFNQVQYDSRNPKGNMSVVSWPWLQRIATDYGWDYDSYSAKELVRLRKLLIEIQTDQDLNNFTNEVRDAFLCAVDLEQITMQIKEKYRELGIKISKPAIKKLITERATVEPDADSWTYTLTDDGNLHRFCALFKDEFYYARDLNKFLQWDNDRWLIKDHSQDAVRQARDAIPYMENRTLTADEHAQLMSWYNKCLSARAVRALSDLVARHGPLSTSMSAWNTQKTLIGTPSGVCNLETGMVSANTPQHRINMHTRYDWTEESTCPRWDRFILEIMNHDKKLALFLQKVAGYSLFGGNPEQLFLILAGHGANGKSTFVTTLKHIMKDYAATASSATLVKPYHSVSGSAASPDLVALYRKRLVICNEWDEKTYLNEGLLKVLTGGSDEISVRALYSNSHLNYVPEFVLMLATNHLPNITGMDYGIWRRIIVIPFDINFNDAEHAMNRDPHLEQYFKEKEGPGIMNWLIEGYKMWRIEGLNLESDDDIPQACINTKGQYKNLMDTIGQFLQECCYTPNTMNADYKQTKAKTVDLHKAYTNWATENGFSVKGTKTFSQELLTRRFKNVRVGTTRGFRGIRLYTINELAAIEADNINNGNIHIDESGLSKTTIQ